MIGHNVTLKLTAPDEKVAGELRRQSVEGVWVYHGWAENAKVRFYPQHRIVEIQDEGPIYR